MMAVRGVRRSWETDRSKAVLISSLRRSATVSTRPLSSSARLSAAASTDWSAGTIRSLIRSRSAAASAVGSTSVPICSASPSAAPGGARQRERGAAALVARDRSELDRGGRRADRRGEPLRRHRERIVEARAAEQQPRHLCCEVGLATTLLGFDGARARDVGDEAGRRGDDDVERGERDPVSLVGERQAPDRRQVEEVERDGAGDRGREAEPDAPVGRDDDDADQVDDAERDDGGDVGDERIDRDRLVRDRRARRRRRRATSDGRDDCGGAGGDSARVQAFVQHVNGDAWSRRAAA